MLRRADAAVPGGGVSVGSVEIVCPIVYIIRTGFDVARPRLAVAHHRHATGGEDAHHLGQPCAARVLGHDQVHQVRRVRQAVARPSADRHRAVEALGADGGTGLLDSRRVGVQALDDEGVAGAEGGGQVGLGSAAEMDDEPAADAGGAEDGGCPGLGRGVGHLSGEGAWWSGDRLRHQQHAGQEIHAGETRPNLSARAAGKPGHHDDSFRWA